MSESVLLETRKICKVYRTGQTDVHALREVTLTVAEGSLTLLTGPSGSGKTTLLSLLGALDRPSSGQVLFRGSVLSSFSDVALARLRRRMGFVFQGFSLIAGLPVWENITYPLVPQGMPRRERYALAQQLLSQMGMADKLDRSPIELSGGEKQRVAVARAFAGQPEVIFADEPISNLDAANRQAVLSLLEEYHRSGHTLILSTHDPGIVSLPCTVYELEKGEVKAVTIPDKKLFD